MKTRCWVLILAMLMILSLAGSLFFWSAEEASRAKITSRGQVVRIVELDRDQEFTVETEDGYNIITVRDGKIAVTEASCPDHYCMDRGYVSGGVQIVCLPNRLVIEFLGEQEVDGALG